ncbi:MAG TPA: DUF521 domain-containing protein [Thermoprotei archaeon]|nr:DUF521 domain-containing protein [Thermoprotei archaeon]
MYLTNEEEKALEGEFGEALEKAMRILVAIGDVYGAERLIKISSAHISGVSYKTIGDAGLDFLQDLASLGAKVLVKTTLNPCGMDPIKWRSLGIIDEDFAKKQMKIIESYTRMGVEPTLTCTPYYISNVPKYGEDIAWAESSAVIYANSVIGAKTNREGAPSALAAAIVGKTPMYGYHLEENRIGTEKIIVKMDLEDPADYGALGIYVARMNVKVPYFVLDGKALNLSIYVKYLGAALAAEGSVAMMHIEGFTPEWNKYKHEFSDKIIVEKDDIKEIFEEKSCEDEEDLIALGCPHLSVEELRDLLKYRPKRTTWISIGMDMYKAHRDLVNELERRGYIIAKGTCFVVSPIERKFKVTATNSGKASKYLPSFCKQCVILRRTKDLLVISDENSC